MKAKKGQPNWKNRTIWTKDNLTILRQMNRNSVDLIYLDPPFNSNHNYAAPIGSPAEGAEFSDVFYLDDIKIHWIDEIQSKNPKVFRVIQAATVSSDKAYLAYMAPRLMEMEKILKDTGSIFLHCDPTMSHYIKLLMDAIFGKSNFRNEIVWAYTGPGSPKMRQFNRKHDLIFWYSKGETWTFNKDDVRLPYKDPKQRPREIFNTDDHFDEEYIKEMRKKGKVPETWWTDIAIVARSKKENEKYPTQKPVKLLTRIIKAASNKGDIVFDPFCGCATACVVADQLGRQWMGIDISAKAAELVVKRIKKDQGLFEEVIHRIDVPKRTDMGKIPPYDCSDNKNMLYGAQDGRCNGCKHRFPKRNLTFDHIVPRSAGGGDNIENLQLLCAACNSVKGKRGMGYLRSVLDLDSPKPKRKPRKPSKKAKNPKKPE